MSRLPALALAAALLLPATAGFAAASEVNLTDEVADQIRSKLSGEGYQVGKIKTEDGLYEAYAKKEGEKLEVFLDGDLEIVRTKIIN